MTAKGNPYTRPPPGVLRSCWIVVEVRKGHDLRDILLRLGTDGVRTGGFGSLFQCEG